MNKKKLALTLLLSSVSFVSVAAETPAAKTPAVETPAVETPAAKTPAAKTPAVETPAVETPAAETPGYFASALSAVNSNRVMTAALVTTCVFVGAVVHAAVASNNDVDAEDAE